MNTQGVAPKRISKTSESATPGALGSRRGISDEWSRAAKRLRCCALFTASWRDVLCFSCGTWRQGMNRFRNTADSQMFIHAFFSTFCHTWSTWPTHKKNATGLWHFRLRAEAGPAKPLSWIWAASAAKCSRRPELEFGVGVSIRTFRFFCRPVWQSVEKEMIRMKDCIVNP